MTKTRFSLDPREDGSARLSLSYSSVEQTGISRISCEIPASELVQLALFAEIIGLQAAFGTPRQTDLALDGLVLSCSETDRDVLSVTRQVGMSTKSAQGSVAEFLEEMAEVTDICLGWAEESAHGPILKDLLNQCAAPAGLGEADLSDPSDLILHRLRELALLILAEETSLKGSKLARKLRRKTKRHAALADVEAVLGSLAQEFLDDDADLGDVSQDQSLAG